MVTQLGVAKCLEVRQVMAHQTVREGTAVKRTVIKPGLQPHHSESFENSKVNKPYIPLLLLPTQPLQVALLFCWGFCSCFM